jgi:N-glycosylase/DNA lyase
MADASRIVLADVLELRTDVKIVRAPDRYMDPRGRRMWDTVARLAGIS